MRNASTLVTVLTLASCVTVSTAAHADDPREKQAEPIYLEGVRLHDRGQLAPALEKFRQAYAIYPSPVALNAVAREELLLGKDLEAVRHLRQVLANPLTHPQTAQKAKDSLQELEARLGRLNVQAPEGMAFVIDGERYVAPVALPIDVKPGEVRVEGTLGDVRYRGSALAVAGKIVPLEMKAEASAPAGHVTEPPPPEEKSQWGTGQYAGVGLVAAGVIALGTGVGFAIAKGKRSDDATKLEPYVGANESLCAGSAVPRSCDDLRNARDDRDRNGTIATAFFVGGAVAVVGGALSFLLWPKAHESRVGAVVTPLIGPGTAGMQLHF